MDPIYIAYIAAGLFVGFAVGATGVGGGVFMTPLLVLGFGLPYSAAVGTDLLFAAGTKGFGVFLHRTRGTIDWRIVRLLALGSVPASLLTGWALHQIGLNETTEQLMKSALAVAILLTALGVFFKSQIRRFSKVEALDFLRHLHREYRAPMTVVAGVLLGGMVTLSSVGAGVIGAMALLILYPALRPIAVVGTDIAHAVILTLVAGLVHFQLGTTQFDILLPLLIGSLPGIYIGTRLGLYLPDDKLRPTIVIMLIVTATIMVLKA